MKFQKSTFLLAIIITYFSNIPLVLSCCGPGSYDGLSEELSLQPTPICHRLVEKVKPLKHYSVDITQYTNAKTTRCHFVEPQRQPVRIGAIIGADDRTKVSSPQGKEWKPIGHLEMKFPNGESYIGSGTIVSSHHVLTAGHCAYGDDIGGWATSMSFTPAQDGAVSPFGSARVTKIYTVRDWVKQGNRAWDFALLVVDKDIGFQTGWYGIMAPSDEFLRSLPINVTGYPSDKGGRHMYTMPGKLRSLSDEMYTYTIDTYGGQSGAAVWSTLSDSGRYCSGIHTYGKANVENTATRISDAKFDLLVGWMNES